MKWALNYVIKESKMRAKAEVLRKHSALKQQAECYTVRSGGSKYEICKPQPPLLHRRVTPHPRQQKEAHSLSPTPLYEAHSLSPAAESVF